MCNLKKREKSEGSLARVLGKRVIKEQGAVRGERLGWGKGKCGGQAKIDGSILEDRIKLVSQKH